MASSNPSTSYTGSHIVLAGLVVQIGLFAFFVTVSLVFHRRVGAIPIDKSNLTPLPWERVLYVLYSTSGLILTRSIVRMAEFIEGFDGYIILHEAFLYVFDALLMAAVMLGITKFSAMQASDLA